MAETYYDLLRRPEWQKKRLVVMERAEFRCEECGAADKTLNVHHRHYTKGAKPWEYADSALVCLCEACHKVRHKIVGAMKIASGHLDRADLSRALGYVRGMLMRGMASPGSEENVSIRVETEELATGLADAYEIAGDSGVQAIFDARDEHGRISHAALAGIRRDQQEAQASR